MGDFQVPRDTSRLSQSAGEHSLTLFGHNKDIMARKLKAHVSTPDTAPKTDKLQVEQKPTHKQGSFTGVFIPTCENMWGVLIFLKFFTIVAEGGMGRALLAVFLSSVAAYATTVCLASIASSGGIVSEGGPYYMISRALGAYIGATVGLVYWFGITLLAVLESLGAVHTVVLMFPTSQYPIMGNHYFETFIGAMVVTACSASVYAGTNLVSKMGSIFFGVVLITLLMFYTGLFAANGQVAGATPLGLSTDNFVENWWPDDSVRVDFGSTLGLFFPCFTGMLSGADRADLLKNPSRNIRYGTFGAVTLSLVIYLSLMFLWSGVACRSFLLGYPNQYPLPVDAQWFQRANGPSSDEAARIVLENIVTVPNAFAAYVGIFLSCLAQVLQCLMVAPKLLQAIAKDSVLPILKRFDSVTESGEPRAALLLTYGIALVLNVSLNFIASVQSDGSDPLVTAAKLVTICFLVCYAFLNATCLILTFLRTTTWRPEGIFRFRWRMWYIGWGLIGLLSSLVIMFEVSHTFSIVIIFASILLYGYIDWVGSEAEWGSGLDGIRFNWSLKILLGLKDKQKRKINWRPQILVMYPNRSADQELLAFVSQLRKGRGMCVVASVFEADRKDENVRSLMQSEKRRIEEVMLSERIFGFSEVVQAKSWLDGAPQVIQLCGIGGLRPNSLVMAWPKGWHDDNKQATDFVRVIQFALCEEKAVLCPRYCHFPDDVQSGFIDLWWFIHDGGLLILLTWLLSQHKVWRNCSVRIFIVMEDVSVTEAEEAVHRLQDTLRRKNILPKGVHVEAVILTEDNMIAPYTYDWTLRAERKAQKPCSLPMMVDDLFRTNDEQADIEEQQPVDMPTSAEEAAKHSDALWARLVGGESCAVEPEELDIRSVSQRSIEPFESPDKKPARRSITGVTETAELLGTVHARVRNKRKELMSEEDGSLVGSATSESASERGTRKLVGPTATAASFERLNKVILSKSSTSSLVLMNMPDIWGLDEEDCLAFVAYCECLAAGLERVVFAKSAGSEIFQLF